MLSSVVISEERRKKTSQLNIKKKKNKERERKMPVLTRVSVFNWQITTTKTSMMPINQNKTEPKLFSYMDPFL